MVGNARKTQKRQVIGRLHIQSILGNYIYSVITSKMLSRSVVVPPKSDGFRPFPTKTGLPISINELLLTITDHPLIIISSLILGHRPVGDVLVLPNQAPHAQLEVLRQQFIGWLLMVISVI